jgi:hypothetical protein
MRTVTSNLPRGFSTNHGSSTFILPLRFRSLSRLQAKRLASGKNWNFSADPTGARSNNRQHRGKASRLHPSRPPGRCRGGRGPSCRICPFPLFISVRTTPGRGRPVCARAKFLPWGIQSLPRSADGMKTASVQCNDANRIYGSLPPSVGASPPCCRRHLCPSRAAYQIRHRSRNLQYSSGSVHVDCSRHGRQ